MVGDDEAGRVRERGGPGPRCRDSRAGARRLGQLRELLVRRRVPLGRREPTVTSAAPTVTFLSGALCGR